MKFIITGSGGCVCTPKPLCQCRVCTQAREKSYPYARCGPSLYLEDAALLVDTPEDIAIALNNANIRAIDNILYSHWDPDHTMGMRVMEQLRLEWLDYYDGIRPQNPIQVYAQADVLADINGIRSKYGPLLDYYEYMGLINRHSVGQPLTIGGVTISLVPVPVEKAVSVFVFEAGGKKLVYAPCDCVPFPEVEAVRHADVLVIGNTYVGDVLKNGKQIGEGHPLRRELHSLAGVLALTGRIDAKRIVITHIEETWGKSFDDYLALEKHHPNVTFAFDTMTLVV